MRERRPSPQVVRSSSPRGKEHLHNTQMQNLLQGERKTPNQQSADEVVHDLREMWNCPRNFYVPLKYLLFFKRKKKMETWNLISQIFVSFVFTALQGEAKYTGHFGDEPMAGREIARNRRLGRGRPTRCQLVALRRKGGRHYDIGSRPLQIRHAGPSGRRGGIWLGLLRITGSHPRFSQIR